MLLPFKDIFTSLEDLYTGVFAARTDLMDEELQNIACVTQDFSDTWTTLTAILGLGATLKIRILNVHVLQFCIRHQATPAVQRMVNRTAR